MLDILLVPLNWTQKYRSTGLSIRADFFIFIRGRLAGLSPCESNLCPQLLALEIEHILLRKTFVPPSTLAYIMLSGHTGCIYCAAV